MPQIPGKEFWSKEKKALWDEIASMLILLIYSGGETGEQALPESVRILINWDVFNQDAVNFLREYRLSWVNKIADTTRDQAVEAIGEWIQNGEPKPVLDERLGKILGKSRAKRIATTEVTRIYAKGNQLAWKATGIITAQKWQTARDESVCFPAWARVETPGGSKPIQFIVPGDKVLTRAGYKSVVATGVRNYQGNLVNVATKDRSLVGTQDHPVWTKKGWQKLQGISVNDRVQSFNNKIERVIDILKFGIDNPDNLISRIKQGIRLVSILDWIMPISPVHFKRNGVFREQEIDGISFNLKLLNKIYLSLRERFSGQSLKAAFSLEAAITGKTTKHSTTGGSFSKLLSAVFTRNHDGGAPAFFRTMMSGIPFFRNDKNGTASFAGFFNDISNSTFNTAMGISVRDGSLNSEGLFAFWTNFANIVSVMAAITFTTAKFSPILYLVFCLVCFLVTLRASNHAAVFGRFVVTLGRTVGIFAFRLLRSLVRLSALVADVVKGHYYNLRSNSNVLYHVLSGTPIPVYNLQVKELPEYYANGILVHNCPLCGPLHNKIVGIDDVFTQSINDVAGSSQMKNLVGGDSQARRQRAAGLIRHAGAYSGGPPRHPHCRCGLLPVVSEEAVREQRRKRLGLSAEKFIAQLQTDERIICR